MKIVDYDTFIRMPKGTIFAAWTPHVMLTDPEIKIDPGREWLIFEQNGERKTTWGYDGTCPIIPHVIMDDGFDYGPVKTDFFYYDGDSNDASEYKMFLIFEDEDIDNMIKVLQWAKNGCPGTDDPNEMLENTSRVKSDIDNSRVWHKCSYEDGRLTHDGSWIPGKWYEWKDFMGNIERARMKQDIPNDHFWPDSKIIFEENVVAFRELAED